MITPRGLRVVVADDSYLVRAGIRDVLTSRGVDVVAEAGERSGLLLAVEREQPDAAIIDIRMPPTHTDEGILAAADIRRSHPDVAVVVLSMVVDPALADRLLHHHPGGVGYLLKDRVSDGAALVDAIQRVGRGEYVLDPTIVTALLGQPRRADQLGGLSPREHSVLALMAEGRDNAGIADQLVLSERTVESHVSAIFDKLGLPPRPGDNRRVLAVLAFLSAPPSQP